MAVPVAANIPGALVSAPLQRRLQLGLEYLLDEPADALAHPGLHRVEPVGAQKWRGIVAAAILGHGVISYGTAVGKPPMPVMVVSNQEITPPSNSYHRCDATPEEPVRAQRLCFRSVRVPQASSAA